MAGVKMSDDMNEDMQRLQAMYGRVRTLEQRLPGHRAKTVMDTGLTGEEYSKVYNHNSHLVDDIGVFRSDCPGCQRHFTEAFGPELTAVWASTQELTAPGGSDEVASGLMIVNHWTSQAIPKAAAGAYLADDLLRMAAILVRCAQATRELR